jgi:hypothetical protein
MDLALVLFLVVAGWFLGWAMKHEFSEAADKIAVFMITILVIVFSIFLSLDVRRNSLGYPVDPVSNLVVKFYLIVNNSLGCLMNNFGSLINHSIVI